MIGAFFSVTGMLIALAGAFRKIEPEEQEIRTDEADYIALSAQIKKLHQTAERIDMLDRMITDIEICDPDVLQKAFSCSWQSGGENREFQFWTTGADAQAEHLMQMAVDEREQLRVSLLMQIDRLYKERGKKNGRKTLFPEQKFTAGEGLKNGCGKTL